MSPRPLLFIEDFPYLGGAEVALLRLIGGLDRQRWAPLVVLPEPGSLSQRLDELGVPWRLCNLQEHKARALNPMAWRRILRELTTIIREEQPALIHANSLWAGLVSALPAWRTQVPVVLNLHAFPRVKTAWKRDAQALVARWMLRPFAAVVTVSLAHRAEVVQRFGHAERVSVVYYGLDPAWFPDDTYRGPNLPNTWPEDAFIIGHFGRLHPGKGQSVSIDALARLHERFPQVRLMLIGEDCPVPLERMNYGSRLRHQAKRLFPEMTDDSPIWFAGAFPDFRDVVSLYRRCQVLIHPSEEETFCLCVAEAELLGLPVVASNVGGLPEVVRDGETGFLVPHGDPEVLALAVQRLIEHPLEREQMGRAAHRFVTETFPFSATVDSFERLYEWVLGEAEGS